MNELKEARMTYSDRPDLVIFVERLYHSKVIYNPSVSIFLVANADGFEAQKEAHEAGTLEIYFRHDSMPIAEYVEQHGEDAAEKLERLFRFKLRIHIPNIWEIRR